MTSPKLHFNFKCALISYLLFLYFHWVQVVAAITAPPPVTSTTLTPLTPWEDPSANPSNLMLVLQRISDRLTAVEALENQQTRKMDNIEYRLTKLEVMIQDKVANIDKPENQVMRKLEDLDWELNKFGTLLDVIRQDIDKVQQRQTEIKVAIASNVQQPSRPSTLVGTGTSDSGSVASADVSAGIQTLSSNVLGLRRMSDSIQSYLVKLDSNLTTIHNISRNTFERFDQIVTKQYFQVAMKELFPQKFLTSTPIFFEYPRPDVNATPVPKDCSEVIPLYGQQSGIYRIQPKGSQDPFFVHCDLETEGGGWTVIQRRLDGSIDFYREWLDYKHGFGNIAGEYWLGNEKIYQMTNQALYELRIELEDFSSNQAHASYSAFALGSELDGYMIKLLGPYEGSAGDSFAYHASMKFSTSDVDNDPWAGGHCAKMHTGGWWYKGCETANLNGQYLAGQTTEDLEYQGVYWYEWHGPTYSLQKVEMKIRKRVPTKQKGLNAKTTSKANKPTSDGKKKE